MIVSMVVAMGPKGEIGLDNKLLWHISEDLKNFKKITTGKMVVMGRKTFESIGRPLPNRTNIVITRDQNYRPEGVIVVSDPMMVFDLALETEEKIQEENQQVNQGKGAAIEFEMMVIGGGEIFNFFLPYTQKIYLSEVDYHGPADAFFPPLNYKDWEVLSREELQGFTFKVLNHI